MKTLAAVLLAALALGGASSQTGHLVLYPVMKGEIVVEAQRIWDVGSRIFGTDSQPDASRLTPADWQRVSQSARKLGQAASDLAGAPTIDIVGSGARLQDEGSPGAPSPTEIENYIAADRPAFSARARDVAAIARELGRASKARDARRLADASNRLHDACEACHIQFWYPDTKK